MIAPKQGTAASPTMPRGPTGRDWDPYGPLARWYRWLERVAFGSTLERARYAELGRIAPLARVLLVGDGDGRFRQQLSATHQGCVISLDRSLGLLRYAGARRSLLADARELPLRTRSFDVVITHFVLDQWQETALAAVVHGLGSLVRPGGSWILSDFKIPACGGGWVLATFWLPVLYGFFRKAARIEARRLEDPSPLLCAEGFEPVAGRSFLGGFVQAQTWRCVAPSCDS